MSDIILETRQLTKEFKGFTAVSKVDLKVVRGIDPCADRPQRRRQDHLLQPAHQVPRADLAAPSSSTARTSRSERPAQIARRGIIRSFQISAVFPHLTLLENVRLGLQRALGTSFHFWKSEKSLDAAERARARSCWPRSASKTSPTN